MVVKLAVLTLSILGLGLLRASGELGLLTSCCQYDNSHLQLFKCVLEATRGASFPSKIGLVTYTTKNILGYSAYSLAINAAYANHQVYRHKILTPEDGAGYEPADERWNKVKILAEALSPTEGDWSQHFDGVDYVVWMDADLIVVDFEFKVEDIVSQYPDKDILLSTDPHPEEIFSLVNTGFVIVKNTPTAKAFLREWWGDRGDRLRGWDQHAFTKLYMNGNNDDNKSFKDAVQLLAPDAVNTHRPATTYHQLHNPVLHMIGSVLRHRKEIFSTGLKSLCLASDIKSLPAQLGLTREALVDIEERILSSRAEMTRELMVDIEVKRIAADAGEGVSYEEVAEMKETLDEIMKLGNPHKGDKAEVQNIRNCLFDMETLAIAMQGKPDTYKLTVEEEISMIEWGLDAAFELCLVAHPEMIEVYMYFAEMLTMRLMEMVAAGMVKDVGGALYYDFKRGQFEALAALSLMNDAMAASGGAPPADTSVTDKAHNALEKAVYAWRKMRENDMLRASSGGTIVNEGSQMLENFGIFQCEQGQLSDGMTNIKEAQDLIWVHWTRTAGTKGEMGKDVIDMMPKEVKMGLVGSYYNLAVCVEGRADQEPGQARALSEEAAEHVVAAQRILASIYPNAGRVSAGGLERVVQSVDGEGEAERPLEGEELEQVTMMWETISHRAKHLEQKLIQLPADTGKRKVVRKKRKSSTK